MNPTETLEELIKDFDSKANGETLIRVPRLLFGEWRDKLRLVQKELEELSVAHVLAAEDNRVTSERKENEQKVSEDEKTTKEMEVVPIDKKSLELNAVDRVFSSQPQKELVLGKSTWWEKALNFIWGLK